ncbi:MAG: hypothetical protein RIR11_2507 [Bacteroidota bacterium]
MKQFFTFCTFFIAFQLFGQNSLSISLAATNAACGASNGAITATATVNNCSTFSYNWSNGQTTNSITGLAVGTYTVTVTSGCTGVTAVQSTAVQSNPGTINISGIITPQTCYEGCTGAVDVTVSAGAPPYTYLWSSASTLEDLTNACKGTYNLTVTDATGCTAIKNFEIGSPPCFFMDFNTASPGCSSQSTGAIITNVVGGTQPYKYDWGHFGGTNNPANIPSPSPGNYSLTVTDANGCTISRQIETTYDMFNSVYVIEGIKETPIAQSQGSITLSVGGGNGSYTFDWSHIAGTSNDQNLTGLSAGTYTVTVYSGDCVATKTYTLTGIANNDCSVNLVSNGVILTANTVFPNNTNLPTYTWRKNSIVVSTGYTASIPLSGSGNYCVTVTNGTCTKSICLFTYPQNYFRVNQVINGCGSSATATLSVQSTEALPPSVNYVWSNGSTSSSIVVPCNGAEYNVKLFTSDPTQVLTTKYSKVPNYTSATQLTINSSNSAYCNITGASPNSLACEKTCPNTTVTYSINPLAEACKILPSKFNWSVSGAQSYVISPDTKEITVTWGSAGAGLVEVKGSTFTYVYCGSRCVEITPIPTAQFTTNPPATNGTIQVCKGQKVWFTNESKDAQLFEWQFSDNLSNIKTQDAQHTFGQPGTYSVLLIARTECLCSDTTSIMVEVLDAVAPSLDCVNTLCLGQAATYTASEQCSDYNWAVSSNGTVTAGGSSMDDFITVLWGSGSVGTIALNTTACASGGTCPATTIAQIPIISDLAEIEGRSRVCPNSEEEYTITQFEGSNYVWSILGNASNGTIVAGQGRNRITIQWSGGSVSTGVVVEYDNCFLGCKGRDTLLVSIRKPFLIAGALENCEGTTSIYKSKITDNNALINSAWTLFGPDGTQVGITLYNSTVNIAFSAGPGRYRLLAVPFGSGVSNTCSDSAEWNVEVLPSPPALNGISGPLQYCAGSPMTYKALGASDLYNVKWEIKNSSSANTFDEGAQIAVAFESGSPRWLKARQVSIDGLGCSSAPVELAVSEIPDLTISGVAYLCRDNEAAYSTQTYSNVTYTWGIIPANAGVIKEGQGTPNIEIYWNTPGNYTVTASICGKTVTYAVKVWDNPVADPIYPIGVCPGVSANLDANGFFYGYEWKNESGTIISTAFSTTVAPGNYALVVTDNNGCKDTKEFIVNRYPKPNVRLSVESRLSFCNEPIEVNFEALVTVNGDYQYEWLRDGVIVGTDSAYTAVDTGYYQVKATNTYGCSDTDGIVRVKEYCVPVGGIDPDPNPTIGISLACPSLNIIITSTIKCDSFIFTSNATAPIVPGTEYWRVRRQGFDDLASFSGISTLNYKFPNAGKYIIQLTMRLTDGSYCNIANLVDVLVRAQFSLLPGCKDSPTQFKDESTFLPDAPAYSTWHWDFNDFASANTDTSVLINPVWSFSGTSVYKVQLTVTTITGCTSSATVSVNIPDAPVFTLTPQAQTCAGTSTAIEAGVSNNIIDLSWNFGDPSSGPLNMSTGNTAFHQYNTAGTYNIEATATAVSGCKSKQTVPIVIGPNTLGGSITPAQSTICEGVPFTLNAPDGGAAADYIWSDGSTTNTLAVTQEGVYTVTISTPNGCTYTTAKTVQANPAPDGIIIGQIYNEDDQLVGIVNDILNVCNGENVFLEVRDNGNYTYQWSGGLGTGDDQSFTDDRDNLLTVGNYNYAVTITNTTTGCTTVTPPFTVNVNPVPEGFTASTDQFCAGTPSLVTYNGPQPPEWLFFWNNGEIGPSFTTKDPGKFFVKVINQYQCSAESNIVIIHPGPNIAAIPGGCHTLCAADTLCVNPIPDISSWQWYFNGVPISGATTPNLVALETGTYYVAVSDTMGCNAISDPLDLTLYIGTGDLFAKVWSDVNDNGIIDPADTLINGIALNLWKNDTLQQSNSTVNGAVVFPDISAVSYTVTLDSAALPIYWDIVIGQQEAVLLGCGAKTTTGFLLHKKACTIPITTITKNVCVGESYTYNGISIPAGSTQTFTTQNAYLCDSTVQVNVVPFPMAASLRTEKVCPSGTFTYEGTAIPVGTSQVFTLTNPATGCDSMVTIQVVALPIATTNRTEKVCPLGTFTYQGTAIPVGTSQVFTLTNPATGCDSMVTIQVVALPIATTSRTEKVCPLGTFTYQGTAIPVGTSQEFTLTNPLTGCDSMVTIQVVALPIATTNRTEKVCPLSTFTYQGTAIPVGTSQEFTLTNPATGCDSMVTIQVVAHTIPNIQSSVEACEGAFYDYNGTLVLAGTTATFTLLHPDTGCDSVVQLTVAALPLQMTDISVNICPNDTYSYNGQELAAGQTYEFHFTTQQGECDSTVFVTVEPWPTAVFSLLATPSCPNMPTGAIEIGNLTGGTAPFTFSIAQDNLVWQNEPLFEDLLAGQAIVLVKDDHDCIFSDSIDVISSVPLSLELPETVRLPCDTPFVVLQPQWSGDTNGLEWLWNTGATTPKIKATDDGIFTLQVKNNCETLSRSTEVIWADLPEDQSIVYLPNVVAPEDENAVNAVFIPMFASNIQVFSYKMEVFDRWGSLVARSTDLGSGWDTRDAVRKQNLAATGVYMWWLTAEIEWCGRRMELKRKGDVTVVR